MASRALHAALIAASFFIASTAVAGDKKKPTKGKSKGPKAAAVTHPEVDALASKIVDAESHADRMAAVEALIALGPEAVPAMADKLQRKHVSTDPYRRKVLKKFKASVPNKKGKFRLPKRTKKKTEKQQDEFDWLAELENVSSKMVGYKEIFLDSALIRALAATKTIDAANALLDFGFTDDGMLMRDECGRY